VDFGQIYSLFKGSLLPDRRDTEDMHAYMMHVGVHNCDRVCLVSRVHGGGALADPLPSIRFCRSAVSVLPDNLFNDMSRNIVLCGLSGLQRILPLHGD